MPKAPKLKSISFKVDEELHTQFRLVCISEHVDMRTEFLRFMAARVEQHKRKAVRQ